MNPKTRRLLQEIANIMPQGEKEAIIESRATHAITSAINVINLIKEINLIKPKIHKWRKLK